MLMAFQLPLNGLQARRPTKGFRVRREIAVDVRLIVVVTCISVDICFL